MEKKNTSLFGLTQELENLELLMLQTVDETGEIPQDLENLIESLQGTIVEKIDKILWVCRQFDAKAKAQKEEAARFLGLAKANEEIADKRRDQVRKFLIKSGKDKLPTDRFPKLAVRNPGGKIPVTIKGEVPEEYLKTLYEINQEALAVAEKEKLEKILPAIEAGLVDFRDVPDMDKIIAKLKEIEELKEKAENKELVETLGFAEITPREKILFGAK